MPDDHEVTAILNSLVEGESRHVELVDAIYAELRMMARAKMASERPGHTLQATALVNEAYLRLARPESAPWKNRQHFFGAASEAMRRILVESARRRGRQKRGGNARHTELDESRIATPVTDEKILVVDEALDQLAAEEPFKAEVVKLRFFVGLNNAEIAEALGVNEKTVRRHWAVAKVLLYELIKSRSPQSGRDFIP